MRSKGGVGFEDVAVAGTGGKKVEVEGKNCRCVISSECVEEWVYSGVEALRMSLYGASTNS